MKPLTPAMIQALRLYGGKQLFYSTNYMHNRLYALRLIRPAIGEGWILTPAGRRVLAEQTTTGDE